MYDLPYRSEGGATLIEVRLQRVGQLFNSLDPAPFLEQDLDHEAEEYVLSAAREQPLDRPLKLVLHIASAGADTPDQQGLERSVQNYFTYRARAQRLRMHEHLRHTRATLVIGLSFLFLCTAARSLLQRLPGGAVSQVLEEGLLIAGWVAMWRPLELILYDWWPIRRSARICAKLAGTPVEVRQGTRVELPGPG